MSARIKKVRSTAILVENDGKNGFEVRSTVTFSSNIAVLRTSETGLNRFSTNIAVLRTLANELKFLKRKRLLHFR
jgi:hypothetical protein